MIELRLMTSSEYPAYIYRQTVSHYDQSKLKYVEQHENSHQWSLAVYLAVLN